MRIGAILPHLLVFGGVRRYIELGNAFIARGHAFTIYTPGGRSPDWLPFGGTVRSLEGIASEHSDVMLCGSPELLPALEGSAARIKIFYLQIERMAHEADIVRSGRYHIMVNSTGLRRHIIRRYGVTPLDGIGAVNPRLFHPTGERGRDDVLRVLCYGRLSRPRKGTRFVVQAVRSMQRRGYPVELHLFDTINPGDEDPRIGFDPGVPFRYYLNLPQSRMAAMYGAADVFVSAEHRAGWSNTAAEAAACGLPLVCTRSGTEDFAEHGRSALVVPVRGAALVRRSLVALHRDRALAMRLGGEAHRRIMQFTWDALCAKMERTFRRIAVGDAVQRTGRERS